MHEIGDQDVDDLPVSSTAPGVLGRTIRNVVVVLGACLVVAFMVGQVGDHLRETAVSGRDRVSPLPASAAKRNARRAEPVHYELVIPRDASGHFVADATVQGIGLRFLIDTGASTVMLSAEDAQRLGLRTDLLDFDRVVRTANGEIRAASVSLGQFQIGELELEEVPAMVTQAPLPVSLLGMSFLARLAGYEVRDGSLVLRW